MQEFTVSGYSYDETALNVPEIKILIDKHMAYANKIRTNRRYYLGGHSILSRTKKTDGASNNRIVCNHAKDISDTASGYFMNAPIVYSAYDKEDDATVEKLTDQFDIADVDDVDSDNAKDMSIAGVAYEYVYAKKDSTELAVKNLDPAHTFLVYDDSIEENLLFGVYYYRFKDAINDNYCYRATVATMNYVYQMIIECGDDYESHKMVDEPYPHYLGNVPIIEYRNNKDKQGDFEQQISLIDAYNTLMSDRVNDKEQFVEALLVIYGAVLGDDSEEVSEVVKLLKENGLLELPEGANAQYISKTLDENGVEILRKAIKEDIYNFSHVPNLSDENFAGNSSGVAMEYKLLGLQMITAEKEKYYKQGLKRRIELFCNYMNLKAVAINPNVIKITFSRKLPKNLSELAQMVVNLKGTVSQETLLSQLPFVEDPESEVERVKEENAESVRQQQEMFKAGYNQPFNQDEGEDTSSSGETDESDIKEAN